MTESSQPQARWELLPRGCFIGLVGDGVLLGLRRRGLDTRLVPFAELTHVESTRLGVWIATRKTTQLIRRTNFESPSDPEELVQAIRWRLAEEPAGPQQLERMLAVAERALNPHPRRATLALAALCVAIFALQWWDPFSIQVGIFYPDLVNLGEYWRVVTGNLLHGLAPIPMHLIINMLCLLAFGLLAERVLGALRTFLVMGASGLTAMLASAVAGYSEVLGASGIVAGMVGSVLWLEFNASADLPAWWRIPRRLFIGVIVLQAILDQLIPVIAAAHLGGFVGGFVATAFAVRGVFEGRAPCREQRLAVGLLGMFVLISLVGAGRLMLREPAALADHGRNLLVLEEIAARALNDLAWRIVTETEPAPEDVEVAVELAQRAVEQTQHMDPNILDTLAEVLFVAGEASAAVVAIDEAIALAEGEIYFREQRRRFTGERDAGDRPDPPTTWVVPAPQVEQMQRPGLRI